MADGMTEDIMFSVEVTTYNQREYIAQTLQSIIDQEHNYKYEILVSDDCSTDGTQEIIKEFQKKYPEIIKPIYNEKNLGPMKNYYQNISRAKGKYLMGCGGDDYWLPEKVAKQINFMERNLDFDVCYSLADVYDTNKKTITSKLGFNYKDFKELITIGNAIPALTLCIRRSFFINYLEQISPQNRGWLMEDYPFLIYTAFESNLFFFSDTFAVYRVLDNSVSHQTDIQKKITFEKSVYNIKQYFSERYSFSIEPFNETKLYEDFICRNSKLLCFLKAIKKTLKQIIKMIIPYGIILLIQKKK